MRHPRATLGAVTPTRETGAPLSADFRVDIVLSLTADPTVQNCLCRVTNGQDAPRQWRRFMTRETLTTDRGRGEPRREAPICSLPVC